MPTCRVLVVDERRLLGTVLAEVLSRDAGVEAHVLQDISTLAAALTSGWDVIIASEAHAPRVLRARPEQARVLVLLHQVRVPAVAALLRLGAAGVCSPQDSPEDVLAAVRQVADQGMRLPVEVISPVLLELARLRRVADEAGRVLEMLTEREREVLDALGRGHGRTEIGRELGLSPHTVRTHVQHLLAKLSLHSQLEAAAFARELGAALLPSAPPTQDTARVIELDSRQAARRPSCSTRGVD